MATCTLACETQEAIIRYTTNGVDPTETDTVYSVPFTVDTGATVKAKAWKDGMISSAVASAEATEPLTPTSVPLGSVLNDGSVVIYDRGATYGDYNLTSGVLTRLSEGVDDESATSNNWRFLIADSADMEGNNGGTGDNKPWSAVGAISGITFDQSLGLGLPNTNTLIAELGSNESYLWYEVSQRRTEDNIKWFVPSQYELAMVQASDDGYLENLADANYFSSNYSSNVGYSVTALNLGTDGGQDTVPVTSTDCRVRLLRRY